MERGLRGDWGDVSVNLSAHFTLEEAVFSETAKRRGIDNTPTAEIIENMKEQASGMERVRELLGNAPIRVSSWYRGPKLNAAIGGSKTSAHMDGYATDFTCSAYGSVLDVCRAIMDSTLEWDQLIREYDDDNGGGWVHISFKPTMRKQNLTIDGSGTRSGIA